MELSISIHEGNGKKMRYIFLYFSTPAPGYFDGDDILDFMVHNSVGAWPHYSSSNVSLEFVFWCTSLG